RLDPPGLARDGADRACARLDGAPIDDLRSPSACGGPPLSPPRSCFAQFAVPESRTRNGCVTLVASWVNSRFALRAPVVVSGLKRTRYCTKSPARSAASP